uniref:Uncharacterized protein n=1 Tax=Arundo donax TaxID=35708 RepID=A0A0A9HUD6_ARUDO
MHVNYCRWCYLYENFDPIPVSLLLSYLEFVRSNEL